MGTEWKHNILPCGPTRHAKATASAFILTLSLGKNLTHAMDQIVSLFSSCLAVLHSVTPFWDSFLLFFPLLPLSLSSDAMGWRVATLQWGSPAMTAVYSTVTVHPSDWGHHAQQWVPSRHKLKMVLYLYQYIVVKLVPSQGAFKDIWIMLCCVVWHSVAAFNGVFRPLFRKTNNVEAHHMENMYQKLHPDVITYNSMDHYDIIDHRNTSAACCYYNWPKWW